jgi:hypothetical protein
MARDDYVFVPVDMVFLQVGRNTLPSLPDVCVPYINKPDRWVLSLWLYHVALLGSSVAWTSYFITDNRTNRLFYNIWIYPFKDQRLLYVYHCFNVVVLSTPQKEYLCVPYGSNSK